MKMVKKMIVFFGAFTILAIIAGGSAAAADMSKAAKFYRGNTIKFISPFSVGGGFDTTARLLAPQIKKITGAHVIVINRPGAGGLIGTNMMYASKPNGLTIGMVSGTGATSRQMVKDKNAKFDLTKFTWIGGVSTLEYLLVVGKHTEFKNVQELMNSKRQIKLAMGGSGSGMNIIARILALALGFKLDPVLGFDGSSDSLLSVLRGETDGVSTDILREYPGIKSGDLRPMVFVGKKRHPLLPDVSAASELDIESRLGKEALAAAINISSIGRVIGAPPNVPPERAAFLQNAVAKACQEPELLEAAKKSNLNIEYLSPDEVKTAISQALGASEEIKTAVRSAFKKSR